MSDGDGEADGEAEEDVQDDAIHTFLGHSGAHCMLTIICAWHRCGTLHNQHPTRLDEADVHVQMRCSLWHGTVHPLAPWHPAPATMWHTFSRCRLCWQQACWMCCKLVSSLAVVVVEKLQPLCCPDSMRMQAVLQANGAVEHRLDGHTDTVACLAFSSDGSKLASGGLDGELAVSLCWLWELPVLSFRSAPLSMHCRR